MSSLLRHICRPLLFFPFFTSFRYTAYIGFSSQLMGFGEMVVGHGEAQERKMVRYWIGDRG